MAKCPKCGEPVPISVFHRIDTPFRCRRCKAALAVNANSSTSLFGLFYICLFLPGLWTMEYWMPISVGLGIAMATVYWFFVKIDCVGDL
jgi:hypothetical protein